jgi:hypothetical protein
VKTVNEPMSAGEREAVRTSIQRNRPFGSDAWKQRAAQRLGLSHTIRPEGRPKRKPEHARIANN